MPRFNEMSPEKIREVLDATDEKGQKLYVDILTPLAEKEQTVFNNSACPKCGAYSGSPILDTRRPFTPSSPLPNKILRCTVCSTEWDPHTRLIRLASIIDGPG